MCLLIDGLLVLAAVFGAIYLLGLVGVLPAVSLSLGSFIHLAIPIIAGLLIFWVLCRVCGIGLRCCRTASRLPT